MYAIGLIGNIGSGKSTVAGLFQERGIYTIHADDIARELTTKNEAAYSDIVNHFGQSIIDTEGDLNRSLLRKKIFDSPKEKQFLEELLHPLIRSRIQEQLKKSPSLYTIIEIPLLQDKKNYPYLNRILLILSEKEKQIQRVIERDNITQDLVISILNTQPADINRQLWADDIVFNNGSLEELNQQVENLHQLYLKLTQKKSELSQ